MPARSRSSASIDRRDRHRGLEGEGDVLAGDLRHHCHRHEAADRVAAAQVVVEHLLVGRGCQVAEPAAVLEDVGGDRQPGRVVVELDVAGPGRFAATRNGEARAGGRRSPRPRPPPPPGRGVASRLTRIRPTSARIRIAGSVSFAVVSVAVPNWASTIIAAIPIAGRTVQGNVRPVNRSTKNESPTAVASNADRSDEPAENQVHGRRILCAWNWLGSGQWRERQMP